MEEILGVSFLGATGSTSSHYFPAPYRCIVKELDVAPGVDPGDAETVTVKKSTTTVGVLTFGTDIAAGASGAYVADATNGYTVFEKGDNIILECSQLTAAATFNGHLKLDRHCVPAA